VNADRTVNARIAHYRERQRQRGMIIVRVWVPTQADADEIKKIAAEMRQRIGAEVSPTDSET